MEVHYNFWRVLVDGGALVDHRWWTLYIGIIDQTETHKVRTLLKMMVTAVLIGRETSLVLKLIHQNALMWVVRDV